MVLAVAVAWGGIVAFSPDWQTGFVVGTSVVTLMMVFVIQHTQSREQAATQRKLDELLRALPEAESGLMMLEEAPEEELRGVEEVQRETKDGVRRRKGRRRAVPDQAGGAAPSHTMASSSGSPRRRRAGDSLSM
jgi:low affinity Fe/Cu permease